MKKQEIIKALNFEPFSVFAARSTISVLTKLIDYYDRGIYSLEQFENIIASERRTGKTTSALLDVIEYITEHSEIEILIIEFLEDYDLLAKQAAKDVTEYLDKLYELGEIPKQEILIQTKQKSLYPIIASRNFGLNGYIHKNTLTVDLVL